MLIHELILSGVMRLLRWVPRKAVIADAGSLIGLEQIFGIFDAKSILLISTDCADSSASGTGPSQDCHRIGQGCLMLLKVDAKQMGVEPGSGGLFDVFFSLSR